MHIGFDAKRAFLNETGLGNYSRDTIKLLAKYYPDNKYSLYTPEDKKNKRFETIRNNKNVLINTPKKLINKIFKNYWRSKLITKQLIEDKIDVFHGLSHELPIGIEKTKIKTVVTIHDLIFIRYPELFSLIDRKIYKYKFKSACKRADKIIAVSEQTKKDIINFFSISPNKIHVIYQGCNKVFQEKKNDEFKKNVLLKYKIPKNYILYVGSIEKRKNLLSLLKAIKELPNQQLVIIGNGGVYKNKCIKYCLDNKIKERVFFLSDLNLKEISILYDAAQIMVYPSVFEGFGIPILESLFSKTPVITSKGGCFSEAGGPTTKYINPLSINNIKNTIKEIQSSKVLQNKMQKKGYEYAQKFKDNKIADNLMNLYKEL